jgi:transposase, IS5 family
VVHVERSGDARGLDAQSGLVHTVRGTAGNVNDVVEANSLLHGDETEAFADAGYQGAHKRDDAGEGVRWNIAMRPGKRAALDNTTLIGQLTDQLERLKASIRSKVEHPFRVIKQMGLNSASSGVLGRFGLVISLPAVSNRPRGARKLLDAQLPITCADLS